jgi:hypothetical protein
MFKWVQIDYAKILQVDRLGFTVEVGETIYLVQLLLSCILYFWPGWCSLPEFSDSSTLCFTTGCPKGNSIKTPCSISKICREPQVSTIFLTVESKIWIYYLACVSPASRSTGTDRSNWWREREGSRYMRTEELRACLLLASYWILWGPALHWCIPLVYLYKTSSTINLRGPRCESKWKI